VGADIPGQHLQLFLDHPRRSESPPRWRQHHQYVLHQRTARNKTLIDYSATKGAVLALTYSLAQSLQDRGIRVNCVAPGPVWTR